MTTPDRPGRAMGIDLGSKRIGVAVSDTGGVLASPQPPLVRSGDRQRDRQALADLAVEFDVTVVVIGHPRALDGHRGTAARDAEEEAQALEALVAPHGITVELADERLTTVSAQRALREGGTSARHQRRVVDGAAAAVMLGAWLDGRRRHDERN